jgi:diguanylate cyclase (GGDEF)-like protein/PAS domain S-box-containing protein
MQLVGRVAAAVVGAAALAVLFGWYTASTVLTSRLVSMKPTTALAIVLLSIALVAFHRRRLTRVLSALVLIIGGISLVENILNRSLGMDTLLPGIMLSASGARMAPSTALCLCVLGGSVLFRYLARSTLTLALAVVTFCISQIAIIGYAYGASSLYAVGGYTSMSLFTAVAIGVLSGATLLQYPCTGLVVLSRDTGSGGRLLRPAIPFFIVVPFALGWLSLSALRMDRFDTAFAIALLVWGTTILGCTVTWIAARRLRELDRQRDGALNSLAETNCTLEATVAVRTRELAGSADALQAIVQLAPVGILELDSAGGLLTANDQWLSVSGLTLEESVNDGWMSALHPDDVGRVSARWGKIVAGGTAYAGTVRFRTPDGQIHWAQVATTPIKEEGAVIGHLASVTDITALRDAEASATAAQARFEAAFVWSPLGTAIVSLDGLVLEANQRLLNLTGRSTGVLDESIESVFMPLQPAGADNTPTRPREHSLLHADRQVRRSDSEEIWVTVSIAEIKEGTHVGALLYQLEEVTERRLAEARVKHLAFHDPLTNLPNRLLLMDRLAQALLQATRNRRGVGVLFIDLDRFKVVNDSVGHHSGDAVLSEVATRLRNGVRTSDTVARIGGDEFVVICPDIANSEDITRLADALQKSIALPIRINEHVAFVDASIGIAFSIGNDDPETILRDADQAMYLAKDRGRARYEVFDDDLRDRHAQKLDTEIALRSAVDRGQIETWYQPVVDLRERKVVATEALARWRRPEHGLVLPGYFIALAEEVGLIKQIGRTVLDQACRATAALDSGIAVSVNVSGLQFVRDDFFTVVTRALNSSGLSPDRLWLELTESAMIDAADSAAKIFNELRDLGVRLAIDDFGTGYSSISHLRTFDVDLVKIDSTFVRDIEFSARDRAIVEGIIQMADLLELQVVAEGIETPAQLDLLLEMGCRFGQGHLFSAPSADPEPVVPFEDFLAPSAPH